MVSAGRVLPAFVHEFEAVAVRVEDIGGEVARIVMQVWRGGASGCGVVGGTRADRGHIRGADLRLGPCDEADMRPRRSGHSLLDPEEDTAVRAETFQVGMPRRAVLAVVVVARADAERRQDRLLERDRAGQIAHRQNDEVTHGVSRNRRPPKASI